MADSVHAGVAGGIGRSRARSLSFWQKLALGIAALAIFGFGQFAARGFVDIPRVPYWVHVHAIVMLSWLGLLVVQPWLAERGGLALHRRLGWFAVGLAVILLCLATTAALMAMILGRIPPVQTPGYFLAMNMTSLAAFALLFGAAIWKRRNMQAHQRLVMAATVMVIDPGIARALPFQLLGPWNEIGVMIVQLAILGIVLRHDCRTLGRAHGATLASMLVIAGAHGLIEGLGRMPSILALGTAIAGTR